MASTNKTESFGLNIWSETDRPQRNDFNSDNIILDKALGEHVTDTSLHLTETEKERVQSPLAVYSYAGDGAEYKDITLPFDARYVMAYRPSMPFYSYDSASEKTLINGGFAFYGGEGTGGVKLMSPALVRVYSGEASNTNLRTCLNDSGVQYKLVAFR